MKSWIFYTITEVTITEYKIYKDTIALALLDIIEGVLGHSLVISKQFSQDDKIEVWTNFTDAIISINELHDKLILSI